MLPLVQLRGQGRAQNARVAPAFLPRSPNEETFFCRVASKSSFVYTFAAQLFQEEQCSSSFRALFAPTAFSQFFFGFTELECTMSRIVASRSEGGGSDEEKS